jgi:hypothetical protein
MELFPLTNFSTENNLIEANHACEYIASHFTTKPGFGRSAESEILRVGDLITDCYLRIKLPGLDPGVQWVNDVGKRVIKKVQFKINDVIKESLDQDYMNIHIALTSSSERLKLYEKMLSGDTMCIPLIMFFNKHKVNYLPLTERARYTIVIEFEKIERLVIDHNENKINLSKIEFESDPVINLNYVYVLKNQHPALMGPMIEQKIEITDTLIHRITNDQIMENTCTNLAFNILKNSQVHVFQVNDLLNHIFGYLDYPSTRVPRDYRFAFDLDFKMKCKELWWVICPEDQPLKYTDMMQSATISLNQWDRFSEQSRDFFTNYQQWINHTNHVENVQVYAFGLNPENNMKNNGLIDFESKVLHDKKLHLTIRCPCDKFYKLKIYGIGLDVFEI